MEISEFILSLFMILTDAPDALPAWEKPPCHTQKLASQTATVEYTGDGDTVGLRADDGTIIRTRLAGIDSPETHYNDKNQGPWAFKAAARLKQLLPKKTAVRLEFDETDCDSRGRTIAHLFVGDNHVNRTMVSEGWAVNYCVAPNFNHCEDFRHLVDANIRDARGFLADPTVRVPYLFRSDDFDEDPRYFVGDIDTKAVIPAAQIETISVGRRVFFYSPKRIQPPYQLKAD